MISKHIRLIYKYMLTMEQEHLESLLMDPQGIIFVNEYFDDNVKQECVDIIARIPIIQKHYEQQVYYIKKYVNKKRQKGCFSRI